MEIKPNISLEEKDAIRQYKEYQAKHLANMARLSDYYVSDFDHAAYPDCDRIDALKQYIGELSSYFKSLSRADFIRQKHYEQFIANDKNRQEDKNHKAWREGLNSIVKDCDAKLKHWTNVNNQEFDKLIEQSELGSEFITTIDITVENVDYKLDKRKTTKKNLRPPRVSNAEKIKLRKEYKRQLIAKQKETKEFLIEAEKDNMKFNNLMTEIADKHSEQASRKILVVDIYDKWIEFSLDRISEMDVSDIHKINNSFISYFINANSKSITPVGEEEEFYNLIELLYVTISDLQDTLCEHKGCEYSEIKISPIILSCSKEKSCINIIWTGINHKCRCISTEYSEFEEMIDYKISVVLDLFRWFSVHSSTMNLWFMSLLDIMFLDMNIESDTVIMRKLLSHYLGSRTQENFIKLYKMTETNINNMHNDVKTLARLDIDVEMKKETLAVYLHCIKKYKSHINILKRAYPIAIYESKLSLLIRLKKQEQFLTVNTLDKDIEKLPYIDYAAIKKELGIDLIVPQSLIALYKLEITQYKKKLKRAIQKTSE
jgi:hypothetical protein